MKNDIREYVARAINHALLESWQYEKTILAILELEDRAMLQKDNTHKVTFVKSTPKQTTKREGFATLSKEMVYVIGAIVIINMKLTQVSLIK